MNQAMINQARATKAAEDMIKAAGTQPVGYVIMATGGDSALFVVHASTCQDIAKDAWKTATTPDGIFSTIEEVGQNIADNYGGYTMPLGGGAPDDSPVDLAHALSWSKFKACVGKAGLKTKGGK
jgi:hypothetical protein